MYATTMADMDWAILRGELENCRVQARLGKSELGRMIGRNKSTITRVEDVYGNPEHKPDLATIELIVNTCACSLSEFFLRVERKMSGKDQETNKVSLPVTSEVGNKTPDFKEPSDAVAHVPAFLLTPRTLEDLLSRTLVTAVSRKSRPKSKKNVKQATPKARAARTKASGGRHAGTKSR